MLRRSRLEAREVRRPQHANGGGWAGPHQKRARSARRRIARSVDSRASTVHGPQGESLRAAHEPESLRATACLAVRAGWLSAGGGELRLASSDHSGTPFTTARLSDLRALTHRLPTGVELR